eukprot:tig00000923_g5469.t1
MRRSSSASAADEQPPRRARLSPELVYNAPAPPSAPAAWHSPEPPPEISAGGDAVHAPQDEDLWSDGGPAEELDVEGAGLRGPPAERWQHDERWEEHGRDERWEEHEELWEEHGERWEEHDERWALQEERCGDASAERGGPWFEEPAWEDEEYGQAGARTFDEPGEVPAALEDDVVAQRSADFMRSNLSFAGFADPGEALYFTVKEACRAAYELGDEPRTITVLVKQLEQHSARRPGRFLVRVTDKGPGMRPEEVAQLLGRMHSSTKSGPRAAPPGPAPASAGTFGVGVKARPASSRARPLAGARAHAGPPQMALLYAQRTAGGALEIQTTRADSDVVSAHVLTIDEGAALGSGEVLEERSVQEKAVRFSGTACSLTTVGDAAWALPRIRSYCEGATLLAREFRVELSFEPLAPRRSRARASAAAALEPGRAAYEPALGGGPCAPLPDDLLAAVAARLAFEEAAVDAAASAETPSAPAALFACAAVLRLANRAPLFFSGAATCVVPAILNSASIRWDEWGVALGGPVEPRAGGWALAARAAGYARDEEAPGRPPLLRSLLLLVAAESQGLRYADAAKTGLAKLPPYAAAVGAAVRGALAALRAARPDCFVTPAAARVNEMRRLHVPALARAIASIASGARPGGLLEACEEAVALAPVAGLRAALEHYIHAALGTAPPSPPPAAPAAPPSPTPEDGFANGYPPGGPEDGGDWAGPADEPEALWEDAPEGAADHAGGGPSAGREEGLWEELPEEAGGGREEARRPRLAAGGGQEAGLWEDLPEEAPEAAPAARGAAPADADDDLWEDLPPGGAPVASSSPPWPAGRHRDGDREASERGRDGSRSPAGSRSRHGSCSPRAAPSSSSAASADLELEGSPVARPRGSPRTPPRPPSDDGWLD